MTHLSAIYGLLGAKLTPGERAFFRDADPWAFILFARNIETPSQVKALTSELREAVGRDCLIFVDQEGGRVQRLGPPHWPSYPALATYSSMYDAAPAKARRATCLHHRLIAAELREVGITANCAPVLDIPVQGADPIISDRALGRQPETVIDLANAAMTGLMNGGVSPVIKHIPGHGRALVDSHLGLPVINTPAQDLSHSDFRPFSVMRQAPMAMTAHIVYTEFDDSQPVTLSKPALQKIIRQKLGYDGLLMTDDMEMKALSGDLSDLSARALDAGCDIVLHCSGKFDNMVAVAKGARKMNANAVKRARIAELCAGTPDDFDVKAARAEFESLLEGKGRI